ncbi:hypothetical protein LBMAG27_25260 [Bacteroidota bacterium]|nr:hypothetical protein LBMAG27_25260 [Bacteroidota bacterium]
MEEEARRNIYRHFDSDGFRFMKKHIALEIKVDTEFDPESDDIYYGGTEIDFISIRKNFDIVAPLVHAFNMTNEEIEEVICDYVKDTTGVRVNSIEQLLRMTNMNGLPFFLTVNEGDIEKQFLTLAFPIINGRIIIRKFYGINSLGNIKEINGDLGIDDCKLKSIGSLKIIRGDFWFYPGSFDSSIVDLSPLEFVGGSLNAKSNTLKSLGSLKHVGRTLNLRNTSIENLGKLEFVGWNLFLPLSLKNKIDISKIEVRGKVKYFKEKI